MAADGSPQAAQQTTVEPAAADDRSLSDTERETLHTRVRERGEAVVCREIGISRQTLGRGIAGLDLQRGSVVMIRQGLRRTE